MKFFGMILIMFFTFRASADNFPEIVPSESLCRACADGTALREGHGNFPGIYPSESACRECGISNGKSSALTDCINSLEKFNEIQHSEKEIRDGCRNGESNRIKLINSIASTKRQLISIYGLCNMADESLGKKPDQKRIDWVNQTLGFYLDIESALNDVQNFCTKN